MSFTKQEKRLYIREVAKEFFVHQKDISTLTGIIQKACDIANKLEAFERKQDEEEASRPSCFGNYERVSAGHRNMQCTECSVFDRCQEKRGAK